MHRKTFKQIMEIVIGTYEGPIISYAAKLAEEINFEPQFVEKSHSGCVKSIACNNRYLATGKGVCFST